jgi:hypothetical protein
MRLAPLHQSSSLKWQSWWLKAAAWATNRERINWTCQFFDDNDKMKLKHKPWKTPESDAPWCRSGPHEKDGEKTFL